MTTSNLRSRAQRALLMTACASVPSLVASTAFADDAAKLVADADKAAAVYRYGEACPKYDEAAKLAPSSQAEERAAGCYELWGKKPEAWKRYIAAVALAEKEKSDRLPTLRMKVELQESKFPKLTITLIPADEVPGLVVKRDGQALAKNQLNGLLPLAPGEHRIEATAPGYKPFVHILKVEDGASIPPLRIPQLDEDTHAPAAAPTGDPAPGKERDNPPALPLGPTKADSDAGKGQRIAGYITGGVGVATVITSIAMGISAKATYGQSSGMCDDANRCNATGLALRDDASSMATVSTVTFFAGLAITAVGAVLVFTAPTHASNKVSASPGGLKIRF